MWCSLVEVSWEPKAGAPAPRNQAHPPRPSHAFPLDSWWKFHPPGATSYSVSVPYSAPACQQCADPQVLAFLVGAAFSGADHYLHGTSLTRTRRQARPNAQSHQTRAPRTSCGKGPWQRAILGTTSCSILRHFNQFVSNVQTPQVSAFLVMNISRRLPPLTPKTATCCEVLRVRFC